MTGFVFSSLFSTPYSEGSGGGSTALVPHTAEVALGGHPYMIDWKAEIPLRHQSIPILRQQQDTSDSPGEQSINPEGLWRRVGESWHFGAGQDRFDRKDSNEYRFHSSKGIDPWTRWEVNLLPANVLARASTGARQFLAVAGDWLYYAEEDDIHITQVLTSFPTTLTGTPVGPNVTSITTNGYYVWIAYGSGEVYRTVRGSGSTALHITDPVTLISYVKNRVMCAEGPALYDATAVSIGASGALPAAYFTHGNTDWEWVGFAESQAHIYAAGYSGGRSLIYAIDIKPDGTALDQPTIAGQLPEGEVVTAIYGYLGKFIAIGTSRGFRLALVSEGGGLTIGALVLTPEPVLCFEGQEEFIWYGNSNNPMFWDDDAASSGLGRMSTNTFSNLDAFTPAYATDIYTEDGTGDVCSVVTFLGVRVFTVGGEGVYSQDPDTHIEQGYLRTGGINYGLSDYKTAMYLDVRLEDTFNGFMQPYILADDLPPDDLGAVSTATSLPTFTLGEKVAKGFQLVFKFHDDDTDEAHPMLSWMMQVQPRPDLTNLIYATIILSPNVESLIDTWLDYETQSELDFIENLNASKELVTWQENGMAYTVVLEDYEGNFFSLINDHQGTTGFNSSITLKMKRV